MSGHKKVEAYVDAARAPAVLRQAKWAQRGLSVVSTRGTGLSLKA